MATLSDQQLIQYIQQGRREALGQLFDRYAADLYDFLARLVGDRDQAARLLEEVFVRVPGAVAGLPARESVRGWLYSLAREAGLTLLRQKGWLDSLPPTEEPGPAGLAGDIWKAARAMPAFYRAILIIEELHALSPTEKARALGVQRTDLARLVDEARKSFTRIFDAQARAEGRPTSSQIDPDRIIGLRRRINSPDSTLFSFLPVLVMPESLQQLLRQRIMQAMGGQPLRPLESAAVPPPEPPPPPPPVAAPPALLEEEPEPETVAAVTTTTVVPAEEATFPTRPGVLPLGALAALAGVALALVICGLVYYFAIRDTTKPVVDSLQPPEGGTIPASDQVNLAVTFHDDKGVDPTRCCTLSIDGADESAVLTVTQTQMSWTGPLAIGPHTALVTISDRSGNKNTLNWHFTVVPPGGTPGAGTPTSSTSIPTATQIATVTPPVSLTPVPTAVPPATATPSVTPVPPTLTPVPPSPTPCLVGIFGKAYDDLNANQIHDPNEPSLAGVLLTLQNSSGGTISTTVSDTFGSYQFSGLPFGSYRVVATVPVGWYATTPTIVTVNMFGCGSFVGLDFGFNQNPPTPTATVTPPTPTLTTVPPTLTPTNTPPTPTPVTPTSTWTPSATPTPTPIAADIVVLGQFTTTGPSGGNDQFIELFNRTSNPVNIGTLLLKASNSSGGTFNLVTIPGGTIMGPGKHYLIANLLGYSGSVTPDLTYTITVPNNGGIAFVNRDGTTIIDQVGMSGTSAYKEGTTLAPLSGFADQAYQRKPSTNMECTDTNDNAADFQYITPSQPHNSTFSSTPCF